MAETNETSLDARKLLSLKLSNNWSEYPMEGNLLKLWDVVDGYIQFLAKNPQTEQPILSVPSQKKYDDTRQLLQRQILWIKGFDIWKITTASVDTSWVLQLTFKDGHRERWNIISHWNDVLLPKPSTTTIIQAARENELRLQEEMNRESYFGGSVVFEYMPAAGAWTVWVVALAQWSKKPLFAIKSIMVRTDTGQMVAVKLDQIFTGTKDAIGNNVMKILQTCGYMFDAGKKAFIDVVTRMVLDWIDAIRTMTYEQWSRIPWNEKIPEIDFQKYKTEFLTRGKPVFDMIWRWAIPTGKILGTLAGTLSENAMHIFFLPVFFQNFSKYHNYLTFFQGSSEMALFTVWAKSHRIAIAAMDGVWTFVNGTKVGTKIAEEITKLPMPKVLRPILATVLPLVAWWAMVVWGDLVAQIYLDAIRARWRIFNGNSIGSQYTDGYSALGHVTWIGITDGLHQVNKFARWINDEEEWDLGIPRTEIPLWKWKYFWTIPEINWFQDKINFGTNPWEWMRWALGRDVDTWNQYVDLYRPRLKRAIYDLLGKYARDESMFSDKDKVKWAWWKEKLLEEHLKAVLESGSSGTGFNAEKLRLIEGIIAELPNVIKSNWPNKGIDDIVNNCVEMMKVDTFFITERTKALELRKSWIDAMIESLSADERSKQYVKSIHSRMTNGQSLYAPDINMDKKIWRQELRNRVPSEEKKLFYKILDDDTNIQVDGKSMKSWEYFSIILDTMLDWKREAEFLTLLKKWNKKWVEWSL